MGQWREWNGNGMGISTPVRRRRGGREDREDRPAEQTDGLCGRHPSFPDAEHDLFFSNQEAKPEVAQYHARLGTRVLDEKSTH